MAFGPHSGGDALIGSLPFFIGLAIVMPILGHSTWHLYRKVIHSRPRPRAPDRVGQREKEANQTTIACSRIRFYSRGGWGLSLFASRQRRDTMIESSAKPTAVRI